MAVSACALAKAIGVPRNRVTAILHRERAISADTALRLSRYFGMSAEFWLGLETVYDLEVARQEIGERLDEEVVPRAACVPAVSGMADRRDAHRTRPKSAVARKKSYDHRSLAGEERGCGARRVIRSC